MFNWTYFTLLTLAGFYTAFVAHSQNEPAGQQPLWTLSEWAGVTAGLVGLASFAFALYAGFTFGLVWFFVSFGEICLGAFISGVVKASVK